MSKLGTISCTVEVPVTERELIVVVARVEVPKTSREVIDVVARVEVPRTEKEPVTIWFPKKVVEPIVALSIYAYVVVDLDITALSILAFVA